MTYRGRGRPSIDYGTFVETWEDLLKEEVASITAAHSRLGGCKSTLAKFRERYEREKVEAATSVLKEIELPDAVKQVIADFKLKEIKVLEKENAELKSRLDEMITNLKQAEEDLIEASMKLDEAKSDFDSDRLSLERKLAVEEARRADFKAREEALLEQLESKSEQLHQANQAAAVATKEVEMLREKAK